MNQLERLIGWITVTYGAAFIFRNTSPAYVFFDSHDIVAYMVLTLVTLGFSIIYQSYGDVLNARLGLLVTAGFVWGLTFITVISATPDSPFGPSAAISIIMCIYCFLCSSRLLVRIRNYQKYIGENRRAIERRSY